MLRVNPPSTSSTPFARSTSWIDRSLQNLRIDAIDLLQLHCPPSALFRQHEVFGILDDFVRAGKLRYYGVSVETVDEALDAMTHPGVQSVQIIFNMFRTKPAERVFPGATARRVGIIARVPLASGLLTGKLRRDSTFPADDHRQFNRQGEMFDKGETFSGVPYEIGLDAVKCLHPLVPAGVTLTGFALRWILMFDAVTCIIPGARNEQQARENVRAASLAPLDQSTMTAVREVYEVHPRPRPLALVERALRGLCPLCGIHLLTPNVNTVVVRYSAPGRNVVVGNFG